MAAEELKASELMSTLPFQEVTYKIVRAFCELKLEEGIDLDYKLDWPNDLARIMCAFANTQGGLLLIGVGEEGKTRRPVNPPMGIDGDIDSLRQRVHNIAFDGAYPPQ